MQYSNVLFLLDCVTNYVINMKHILVNIKFTDENSENDLSEVQNLLKPCDVYKATPPDITSSAIKFYIYILGSGRMFLRGGGGIVNIPNYPW